VTVTTEKGKVLLLRDTYLPKIRQARETIEFAYRRGGVTLLEYLDAQRTYREKSLEYLRSLSSYSTASTCSSPPSVVPWSGSRGREPGLLPVCAPLN